MGRSKIKSMQTDPATYIESIGKFDKETVREALRNGGENTVLRVCLGATSERMPLRVLGYAASAEVIQARYFPGAQLQFVYPLHAAEAANGIPVEKSVLEAERFDISSLHIGSQGCGEITGLIDTPASLPDEGLSSAVQEVLARHPDIVQPLQAAAERRQGNPAAYVASHLVMHDSNPVLIPLDPMSAEAKPVQRIISIGAQSERMFYMARMTCRQAGVMPDGAVSETGQLFTRHVLPPYLHCRQGEPSLDDYYQRTRPAHAIETAHSVPSVERDLQFLSRHLFEASPDGFLPAEITLS